MKKVDKNKNDYLERYEFVMALPELLAVMRQKTGLTDSGFCKKHDFDPTYLCRLTKGGFCPRASTIRRLKRALRKEGAL